MGAKILYFSTGWCAPCKILYPIVEQLSKEHNIELIKINAEEDLFKVAEYNIMSVPALVFLKDNQEAGRIMGYTTRDKVIQMMKKAFNS